jgi:uncharacterized damage-inducible protein DinB
MQKIFFLFVATGLVIANLCSQNGPESNMNISDLPYYEIPAYPENYTSGTVIARVVDGLGYRYYWVTEGLRETDLQYKPSEEARTTEETLDHIYGLSKVIVNAARNVPNVRSSEVEDLTWEEKRKATLENIEEASEILKSSSEKDVEGMQVVFQGDDSKSVYPLWNLLNGPLADAIYHTGQVVSFRRSSGNPINPKVSVFVGKTRE